MRKRYLTSDVRRDDPRLIEYSGDALTDLNTDERATLTIEINCSQLEPMLARPGDPGNGVALSVLDGAILCVTGTPS